MSELKPRVLQVIPMIAKAHGGPSIGSVALNRQLRSSGADALMLTTSYRDKTGARLTSAERDLLLGDGTNVVLSSPSRPYALENSFGLLMRTLQAARRADLVHIHGQYMLPAVYAFVSAQLWRTPYGLQAHGSLEPYQRRVSSVKKRVFNALIGTAIIRRASYVLFSSESEAGRARDVVLPQQTVIRPLGAELAVPAAPAIDGLIESLERFPRNKRFLYLGRLATKKRPDLLLRAWASSGAAAQGLLIIAGPDGDILSSDLLSLAESLGVAPSVLFVGAIDGPEKAWLYHRAGTFILPSANENFGLTVGEAMLAGCHVITNLEVAASSFLVAAGVGDVLESTNEQSLGSAIMSALDDPERTATSGKAAKSYATENMSWRPLAEFLLGRAREHQK